MQMKAQAIIINTIMLWVSADVSTPPLANMQFTTANYIYILDITFDSKSCKHSLGNQIKRKMQVDTMS